MQTLAQPSIPRPQGSGSRMTIDVASKRFAITYDICPHCYTDDIHIEVGVLFQMAPWKTALIQHDAIVLNGVSIPAYTRPANAAMVCDY